MANSIATRRHLIEIARRDELRAAMKEYDETIYTPAITALRAECAKQGHTPNGRWDFTVGGRAYQHCGSCWTTLYDEDSSEYVGESK